jgi:crotonobetainyl-CoA:carnitine CoA-transferase CaiB-like acyl-CoA transferase
MLIGRGVPAHAVQHSPECSTDPQLLHLGHFAEVTHAQHGPVTIEAPRIVLEQTPGVIQRAAPVLGAHTVEILTEVLRYDEERVGSLFASGALD